MALAWVLGRLLLAAVFAVAGVAKLNDLPGSRRALGGFGVPARATAVLGTLLPLAELSIAGALLAGPTAAWGALAGLGLVLCFCVAIAWNLARGSAPDCHCFGQLHSSPASRRTVVRNLGLAALAFLLAAGLGALTAAAAVAGVGIPALLAATSIPWLRDRGSSRNSGAPRTGTEPPSPPEGLPVGARAPGFRLPDLTGEIHTLDSLRAEGQPVMLLFSDPHCGPCLVMAPLVARWQRELSDEIAIAVIEREHEPPGPERRDEHGHLNVLLQPGSEVSDAYGAEGTPIAVLVGRDGTVASAIAAGGIEIEALLSRTLERSLPRLPKRAIRLRRAVGRPLRRRELLVRGAGAWAATGSVLAWPLRAVAAGGGNAGRCRGDADCGPEQKCVGSGRRARCACKGYFNSDECGPDCTNFQIDDRNCGGCCRTGNCKHCLRGETTCVDGDCVGGDVPSKQCTEGTGEKHCPQGSVCCAEPIGPPPAGTVQVYELNCRNLKEDKSACGGCNKHCTEGKDPACCFGRCVDLAGDTEYCGHCNNAPCDPGQVCFGGRCRDECPPGTRTCGQTCGHPQSEICCGGKVYAKDELSDGATCCNGKPCPPPGAPQGTQGHWSCRGGKCVCGSEREPCCGGQFYPVDQYPGGRECCGDGKPCPPPGACPESRGYWYCRADGSGGPSQCICALGCPCPPA